MRIFHRDTDQTFKDIELFLTKEEAEDMIDGLQALLKNPDFHHIHLDRISEKDNFKQITIAVYYGDNIHTFDLRSRKLILEDK
jgi:hypothetical protein